MNVDRGVKIHIGGVHTVINDLVLPELFVFACDDVGSAYVFELGDDDCPADVTDDGIVGVDDVLAVVSAWGTSDPDADIDGTVGTDDLLAVLSGWGLCQ